MKCTAFLTPIHGQSSCRLAEGHEDKHEGVCWPCLEDNDPDPSLHWTEHIENWTRKKELGL